MSLQLRDRLVQLQSRQILRPDQPAGRLTTREAELLRYLNRYPSQTVSREELLSEVWGYADAVISRAVDNAVSRLRDKIEADPANPVHLLTEHGIGYRFEPLQRAEPALAVSAQVAPPPTLRLGETELDLHLGQARRGGERYVLTANERTIVEVLLAQSGAVISRQALGRRVFGSSSVSSRAIDSAIHRLRHKLEADPSEPVALLTVRGKGYRLALEEARLSRPLERRVVLAVSVMADEDALWRSAPEATAEGSQRRHEALLELARTHGGTPISGSAGVWLLFSSAAAALGWALATQEALLRLDWPAPLLAGSERRDRDGRLLFRGPRERTVLHTGPARQPEPATAPGRYIGPALLAAQHLLQRVEGGQILLSQALVEALPEAPASGVQLTQLPDESGNVSALPVALRGRRFSNTLPSPHLLPVDIDAFFGRSGLVDELAAALPERRLLTLVGPGGDRQEPAGPAAGPAHPGALARRDLLVRSRAEPRAR